jgi:hypothetical protein
MMAADRITSAERAERQRRVEEAEHSAEMEGVEVTEQWRADAARYVAGEIDTDELVAITRARYGLR